MIKEIINYRINSQHLLKDTIIYKSKVFHSISIPKKLLIVRLLKNKFNNLKINKKKNKFNLKMLVNLF